MFKEKIIAFGTDARVVPISNPNSPEVSFESFSTVSITLSSKGLIYLGSVKVWQQLPMNGFSCPMFALIAEGQTIIGTMVIDVLRDRSWDPENVITNVFVTDTYTPKRGGKTTRYFAAAHCMMAHDNVAGVMKDDLVAMVGRLSANKKFYPRLDGYWERMKIQ